MTTVKNEPDRRTCEHPTEIQPKPVVTPGHYVLITSLGEAESLIKRRDLLKTRNQAQNRVTDAKTHVTKLRTSTQCISSPRNEVLN